MYDGPDMRLFTHAHSCEETHIATLFDMTQCHLTLTLSSRKNISFIVECKLVYVSYGIFTTQIALEKSDCHKNNMIMAAVNVSNIECMILW